MNRSTNMEHVRALYRMANESWRGSPEFAALTAAIVSLSAPKPESAEASAPVGVERNGLPALMAALELADRKGYLPEALQEAWDDLDLSCVPAVYGGDAQQPAADGGFTAADMMDARQEGRREARQRAAMFGPAATLAERVARVATLLDGHGPMAESAAATLRNALASYDVAIAGQQGGEA